MCFILSPRVLEVLRCLQGCWGAIFGDTFAAALLFDRILKGDCSELLTCH